VAISRGVRHRTLEERLELYSRVRELTSGGLQPFEVAATLNISIEDARYWLRVKQPSREVYVPDLTPRPDLAYLLGAYLGDGRTAGEQDKKVRFKVADREFAELLNASVAKILRTKEKPVTMEQEFYCVNYDSAVLYDYLQQPLELQTPLVESFSAMFLRGFFDAEGYVAPQLFHRSRTLGSVIVGAANRNLEYLGLARRLLANLGVSSRLRVTNKAGQEMEMRGNVYLRRRDVYHIISTKRKEVQAFQELVGFAIPKKREKLDDLVELATWENRNERYEWFVNHYERVGHKWVRRIGETSNQQGAGNLLEGSGPAGRTLRTVRSF